MNDPLPVTVIAGFLGAGKTSLVNHLLQAEHGKRIAVLVNDFGAVDVDARLIASAGGQVMSLTNGCVCCTLQGDLVGQLHDLVSSQEALDHVVVETSGVSDPMQVVRALRNPRLRRRVATNGVITLVDVQQFQQLSGDAGYLARQQVAAADILVLNKQDLAEAASLAAFEREWVFPSHRVIRTRHARVPSALVLGAYTADAGRETSDRASPDLAFETWSWSSERPLYAAQLREALTTMPTTVYRAKGFANLVEKPGVCCLVQVVGASTDIYPMEDLEPEARTTLVFIGIRGTGWKRLERTLEAAVADAGTQ